MTSSNGHDVGYIRVSSFSQNTDRQLEGVILEKTFTEKASAKDAQRPVLQECMSYIRSGDCLHVHSIDRLARNLLDLQTIVTNLNEKGVSVTFHKEDLTFTGKNSNPMNKLMLQMMGAFAEFERSLIKERQKEGIAKARQMGKQIGRKRVLNDEQIKEIKVRLAGGESKSALAKEYGIARQTLYSVIQHELKSRFGKVKTIAMMEMRMRMGAVELVNWWKNLTEGIATNTTFEDLDQETQALLLKWEAML
jgi:DNA invertase Pin-like site-specific DNA recombinase